jgi:hypothetical protein
MKSFDATPTRLIVTLILILAGCRLGTRLIPGSRLEPVFHEFLFVERQPLSTLFAAGFDPASIQHIPSRFEPGYRYVFLHKGPIDNVQMATQVLPERMKKAGFQVFSYPNRYTELKDVFAGGPLFSISFQADGLNCKFFNAVDPLIMRNEQFGKEWGSDVYVLEIFQ